MKVLLTGHEGYIGAVMIAVLRDGGHEVVGLDSGLFTACSFGDYQSPIASLGRDIRDVRSSDLEGFDAVIHLAAISNDPLGNLNPDCTYEINHRASVQLAEAAKRAGVSRYLYSSSCSVYGASNSDEVLDESASFSPVTPYAESKVLVEGDVRVMASDEFSPTFLRNATVYGVSPRLRGDLVVNNLVGWAFTSGTIHMKSDGTPWRPLVHVEDVCHAFRCVLEAPRAAVHNEAFNVGRNDQNFRIMEVAEIVHEIVPDTEITFADEAGPDPRCYRVDFSKIERHLPGYNPTWTVKRGAEQLLEAYSRIGLTREELEGTRYMRVGQIMKLLKEGRLDSNLRWNDEPSSRSGFDCRA